MSEFNFKEAKTGSVTLSTTTTGIKGASSIGDVLQNDVIVSYSGACLVTVDYVTGGYMQITAWGVARSEIYPELHVTESLYANSRVQSQQGSVNRHSMWTAGAEGLYNGDEYNSAWDEAISEGGVNDYTNLYYTRVTLPYTADLEIGSKQDRGVLTSNTISRTSGEGIYINGYPADLLLTQPEDALSHANYTGEISFNYADPTDYALKTTNIKNGNGDKIFCQLLMDSNLENLKPNENFVEVQGVKWDVWLDGDGDEMSVTIKGEVVGLGLDKIDANNIHLFIDTAVVGASGTTIMAWEYYAHRLNSVDGLNIIYNCTWEDIFTNSSPGSEGSNASNAGVYYLWKTQQDVTDGRGVIGGIIPFKLPNTPEDILQTGKNGAPPTDNTDLSSVTYHFGLYADDSYHDREEESDNITDDGG